MSNLASRFIIVGTNDRNAKLGQKGQEGSCDLILEFKAPLYISKTVRARNVKFGMQIHHHGY